MKNENLSMTQDDIQRLSTMLESQGLSGNEVNSILNSNFTTFEQGSELDSAFKNNGNFSNILQTLSDGYTMDELESRGIRRQDIDSFNTMLKDSNLTVENAKAINQYSNGSNMILSVKRGTASREEIKQGIFDDLSSKLRERGVSEDAIKEIAGKVDGLDYQKPAHENYDAIRESLGDDMPAGCIPSINKSVKDMNSYHHIDETIEQLDDGLSKAQLPCSMKLYRAVKTKEGVDVTDFVGKSSDNKGYTSTSPLYDSSFAKYDEYDTVMELHAPKGTRGIYMAPFSDYDSVEQEVLLNPNDVYFTEAQTDVIDKNGKSKTMLKGMVLSKDKEGYRETIRESEQRLDNNENSSNLPTKQNRFSKWFSQVRGRFASQRSGQANNTKAINENQSPKKSWELEPDEKSRIQRETAEIAKKHNEMQQTQSEQQIPQQENVNQTAQLPQQAPTDIGER